MQHQDWVQLHPAYQRKYWSIYLLATAPSRVFWRGHQGRVGRHPPIAGVIVVEHQLQAPLGAEEAKGKVCQLLADSLEGDTPSLVRVPLLGTGASCTCPTKATVLWALERPISEIRKRQRRCFTFSLLVPKTQRSSGWTSAAALCLAWNTDVSGEQTSFAWSSQQSKLDVIVASAFSLLHGSSSLFCTSRIECLLSPANLEWPSALQRHVWGDFGPHLPREHPGAPSQHPIENHLEPQLLLACPSPPSPLEDPNLHPCLVQVGEEDEEEEEVAAVGDVHELQPKSYPADPQKSTPR